MYAATVLDGDSLMQWMAFGYIYQIDLQFEFLFCIEIKANDKKIKEICSTIHKTSSGRNNWKCSILKMDHKEMPQ